MINIIIMIIVIIINGNIIINNEWWGKWDQQDGVDKWSSVITLSVI